MHRDRAVAIHPDAVHLRCLHCRGNIRSGRWSALLRRLLNHAQQFTVKRRIVAKPRTLLLAIVVIRRSVLVERRVASAEHKVARQRRYACRRAGLDKSGRPIVLVDARAGSRRLRWDGRQPSIMPIANCPCRIRPLSSRACARSSCDGVSIL